MAKLRIQASKFVVFTSLMMMMMTPYQNKGDAHMHEPEPEPEPGLTWAKTEAHGKDRITVLQFYFHDNVTGDSPTVAEVVPAPGSTTLFGGFGFIAMADDPLTVGPNPSSKLVGRAQGLYGRASLEDPTLIMAMALTFVDGIYNGSSISILARNPIMIPDREFPVVGGTGFFRMARGYALAKTYFFNITSLNAIVAYNITILH